MKFSLPRPSLRDIHWTIDGENFRKFSEVFARAREKGFEGTFETLFKRVKYYRASKPPLEWDKLCRATVRTGWRPALKDAPYGQRWNVEGEFFCTRRDVYDAAVLRGYNGKFFNFSSRMQRAAEGSAFLTWAELCRPTGQRIRRKP